MKRKGLALSDINWGLVVLIMLIGLMGIVNLHSAEASDNPRLYLVQLGWLGAGCLVAIFVLIPDYRITENLAYLIYAVLCLLLVAVLVQGKVAGGAQRWLRLGPVGFQPSELAKLATIICLARYFSNRVRPDSYSLAMLVRPLNPSRPLAVIFFLFAYWNRPGFADPVGTLARTLQAQLVGETVTLTNMLWFRAFLVATVVIGAAIAIAITMSFEKQYALLNPWPPLRRNRLIGLVVGVASVLLALIAWNWNSSALADPFGYTISWLTQQTVPGGAYEHFRPTLFLRLVVSVAAVAYLMASCYRVWRYREPLVDSLVAPIDLLVIPALLILVEPDLGTACIVILIGMTMLAVVGIRRQSFIIMSALSVVVAGVGWFGVLKDYQKRRILTFIDPENDIHGAGWNAIQSIIAVGSGRWLGKGHRSGTQTLLSFLPEQHTDFAFSVWAEETGFVGCLILLALYCTVILMALSIAKNARDTYGCLVAVGVAGLILWQAVVNVAMVSGVAPVVGLTLPLFSYGGSSILTTMAGFGLLLNIDWRRRL